MERVPPNALIGALWRLCEPDRTITNFRRPDDIQDTVVVKSDHHQYEVRGTHGLELSEDAVLAHLNAALGSWKTRRRIRRHTGYGKIGPHPGQGYREWKVPAGEGWLLVRRYFLVG